MMKEKKLVKRIENHYMHHGVFISLKFISYDDEDKRLIFRFKMRPGTKTDMIFSCAPDIKTAMRIPLFQPFRDGEDICLAVSEKHVGQNSLYKMLTSETFCGSQDMLPLALGYDMMGRMVFSDLAEMPHVMYAGTTNSGKSIGLICLILSLIVRQPVRTANLLIFDTGANEMGIFNGIPHLSYPVVNDVQTGIYVIFKLVEEMERRINLEQIELRTQPAIICVIDEFISFVNHAGVKKSPEGLSHAISDLLCRGRHAKIHMVLAAQDPTKENMKVDTNNLTSRIAFRCAKYQNSTTVLGEGGAEKLTGKGAALYKSKEHPVRIQGAYISVKEVEKLIVCVKSIDYDLSNKFLIPELDISALPVSTSEDFDYISNEYDRKELAEIIMWTLKQNNISASRIKEKFSMGNRANDIIEEMCAMGIISEKNVKQPRKILPQSAEDLSLETVHFLEQRGYVMKQIEAIFSTKEEQG